LAISTLSFDACRSSTRCIGGENAFAQNATPEQIALCRAVQRPIALKSIQEKVAVPAWKKKPVWYLVAEEGRMINPQTQHFMAERMKATVRSFAVDHTTAHSAGQSH
jgi:hypothetical protein